MGTITMLARGASILVLLVGLIASAQIAGTIGDMQRTFAGSANGSNQIIPFLVSFLFFASLALLLWIAAVTADAVEELRSGTNQPAAFGAATTFGSRYQDEGDRDDLVSRLRASRNQATNDGR